MKIKQVVIHELIKDAGTKNVKTNTAKKLLNKEQSQHQISIKYEQ